MRIAQVAPLAESVPPAQYGGTERVVSFLTEELVRLGHDVTLFASGDSVTSARLVSGCGSALWRDPTCRETLPHHVPLMEQVFSDVTRFDIIHFHTDYVQFPLLRRHSWPSVTTLHGFLNRTDLGPFFDTYPEIPLVSISDAQRAPIAARTGWEQFTTASRASFTPLVHSTDSTSRSWGASLRRNGSTVQSRSRVGPDCR
jgi:glycosyltransferase involved in cell wall biosynthesis